PGAEKTHKLSGYKQCRNCRRRFRPMPPARRFGMADLSHIFAPVDWAGSTNRQCRGCESSWTSRKNILEPNRCEGCFWDALTAVLPECAMPWRVFRARGTNFRRG